MPNRLLYLFWALRLFYDPHTNLSNYCDICFRISDISCAQGSPHNHQASISWRAPLAGLIQNKISLDRQNAFVGRAAEGRPCLLILAPSSFVFKARRFFQLFPMTVSHINSSLYLHNVIISFARRVFVCLADPRTIVFNRSKLHLPCCVTDSRALTMKISKY